MHGMPQGHDTAARRSLEYHRRVADRLDPAVVARARTRVETWITKGPVHLVHAERWQSVLALPAGEIRNLLTADDELARDLRQTTPFAGVLSPAERWEIIRTIR